MAMFKKLATLATAAAAARTYAKKNPDQASKYVDQAAQFVDKQTKGKYSSQISGAAQKTKSAAGIKPTPGAGPAANGYVPGQPYGSSTPGPGQPGTTPGTIPGTGPVQPGTTPGTPAP